MLQAKWILSAECITAKHIGKAGLMSFRAEDVNKMEAKIMELALIIFAIAATGTWAGSIQQPAFVRHLVLRTVAESENQFRFLLELQNSENGLDFWTDPRLGAPTDIMVKEVEMATLVSRLNEAGIKHKVMIEDVEDIIAEQQVTRLMHKNVPRPQAIDWLEYYDLDEIQDWLNTVQSTYPTASLINIGKSTEDRNLTVVKISTGGSSQKPAVFITATIHAREWISTATATYMINELTANADAYGELLNGVDFYILPVINPDGYAFSHSNQRLWRKTRSEHGSAFGCIGVDGNRNFGFKWGEGDVPGSSGDKCSETYRGPTAFSEPEIAAIDNFVRDNQASVNWTVYVTIHSYGQYFMCPWGYTRTLPPNYAEVKQLSDVAAEAIAAKYGTPYETGSSANVLYYTDGTDQDWAYGSGFFPYSYTMELRDTGSYGFLLPPAQIIPTADETWAGIQVLARNFA